MAREEQKFDPYKPAQPRIPGVSVAEAEFEPANPTPARRQLPLIWIVGCVAALVLGGLAAWWSLRPSPAAAPALQPPGVAEEAPARAVAPSQPIPSSDGRLEVATVEELSKPWSSKKFDFRRPTGLETVPAMVVRLPDGNARRAQSYWAFSLRAPYGRCELEYVSDVQRLIQEYGFRRAQHPMIGDPCTRSIYDPLRYGTVGGAWARGQVVQGSGLRPPLAIEIRIEGNRILAVQME